MVRGRCALCRDALTFLLQVDCICIGFAIELLSQSRAGVMKNSVFQFPAMLFQNVSPVFL